MSLSVPNVIQQAVLDANNDFQKVITDVADGFKRCGFFDNPNWKALLEQCFERKKIGLTNEEIQIYSSVLSDSSYEDGFVNGLTNAAQATSTQSTPFVAGPRQHGNQMSRSKRSSTVLNDDAPSTPDTTKKRKKTTDANDNSSSSIANQNVDLANMMAHLKNSDWTQILPTINNKQKLVKYVNVFEKSKQLDRASVQQKPSEATNQNVASHAVNNVHSGTTLQAVPTLKVAQSVPSPRTDKRRNAIYRPRAKQPATLSVQAEKPVTATATTVNIASSDGGVTLEVPQNNVVLENITNRRTTRRQTQLLAAFSGSSVETRRNTYMMQRTSVLFTMIDILPYKSLLQTFNIFVADTNDKYDYVIAEKICRSAKFLSAVVSGKPIVSLDWIHALRDKKTWLDPLQFLLKDEEGEKHYNFSLSNTLTLAQSKKLFANCSISVTPNTSIRPDLLKDVIFSGGGKFLKMNLVPRKGNEIICVSDESDRKMWPKIKHRYPTLDQIINLEGFSNMIFQFTHNVDQADVLQQY